MLRKIGEVSFALMCLLAVSSFVYAAEEPAEEAPTIGELSAFAEAAEQPAATPAAAPAVSEGSQTPQQILDAFMKKREIEKQAKQAEAAALVKQARHLLLFENKPEEAYELAKRALLLDPENAEADDLRVESGLQLDNVPETRTFEQEKGIVLTNVRLQAALQSLNNTIVEARELYAAGEYEEALRQLRRASFHVSYLSVYTDVEKQRAQVEQMMAGVQADYQVAERKLAAVRKDEAKAAAADKIKGIAERERQEKARVAEEVITLVKDAKFDQADLMLDDMYVLDRSDEIIPILRDRRSKMQHEFVMKQNNAAIERGDLRVQEWATEAESVPERTFNYPDKHFWKTVVEPRVPIAYPSEKYIAELEPQDRAVHNRLQDPVSLLFDQTPLPQVVEVLQQITEVSYSLRRQDLPMDQAPVTLSLDTTLENALNQITELTGMAWKVDGGLVKIGSAESLREYDMRVYNVTDLLLSVEDKFGGMGGSLNLGGGGSYGRSGSSAGSRTSGSDTGGGYDREQFGTSQSGAAGQFGGGGGYGGGGAGGGRGGAAAQNLSQLTSRADNLILLIKQACGEGTWADYGPGLIDSAGGMTPTAAGGGGQGGFGRAAPARGDYDMGGYGAAGGFGAPTGFGMAPTGAGAAALPQGRAVVMANDPQNIVIVQTAEVHRCIERLLREMRDTMKIQIKVDVRFLSVGVDFLREVGFDWPNFSLNPDAYDVTGQLVGFNASSDAYGGLSSWVDPIGQIIGVDADGNPIGVLAGLPFGFGHPWGDQDMEFDSETGVFTFTKSPLVGDSFIGTGLPFFSDTGGLSLDFGYNNETFQLGGLFKIGHSRDEVKTLSAPTITLANGQLGYITVGTLIDYVSGYEVEDNTLVPEVDSVSDAIELRVRPIASADLRYVFLELAPTILQTDLTNSVAFNTFVGQPGGDEGSAAGAAVTNSIVLPQVNAEVLETTVGVPDRGVVMVGGLTSSQREHHEGGVPILDKIPLLKRLFSAEGRKVNRERLFVLARPEIIILGEEEERMR